MDEPKKCDQKEAIDKLLNGAYVFTETHKDIYKNVKGCRTCKEARRGNFCSECGAKTTEKLKIKIKTETTVFRLKYTKETGELYMDIKKHNDDWYKYHQRCPFSIEFFLNKSNWSWIW